MFSLPCFKYWPLVQTVNKKKFCLCLRVFIFCTEFLMTREVQETIAPKKYKSPNKKGAIKFFPEHLPHFLVIGGPAICVHITLVFYLGTLSF